MNIKIKKPDEYVVAIINSGLSIYDAIPVGGELWIPTPELEMILKRKLYGISLENFPLRTRSKIVKSKICDALGYPCPHTFKKIKPRFPGQNFDNYVQKSNNLQIWNEEITPTRRYVIIRLLENSIISSVKVVSGDVLARLDRTGTLTQKYQARLTLGDTACELVTDTDTDELIPLVSQSNIIQNFNPTDYPSTGELLSIQEMYKKLSTLIGKSFSDAGCDQERNRGAILHELVCKALGYKNYQDNGQFPDILHQLLEVKLQTSQTIDLGLVAPNSTDVLLIPMINQYQVRHCDVRYVIYYAKNDGYKITLTNCYMTTGQGFFSRFAQFQGNRANKKLQIPLPSNFFG